MKEDFLKQMQELLADEYNDFIDSLEKPRFKGMRVNLLKANNDELITKYNLKSTKFNNNNYYITDEVSGNDPYHLAGMFYLQEPSASCVVDIADIHEGDWVLDLCAAPGGKSGQIAEKLNNTGLLVSNEYDHKRAQILLSNLERLGIGENIILNNDVKTISKNLNSCFDKVIVDAPCSGEGMLKKHDQAMIQWSLEYVKKCQQRQLEILDEAYKCVKKDGYLIYSTCTYNQWENEAVVDELLKKYPDLELVDIDHKYQRRGITYKDLDVSKIVRILPMDQGEGHFVSKFHKKEGEVKTLKPLEDENSSLVEDFMRTQLKEYQGYFKIINDKVYFKTQPFYQLKNLKVLRQGICCGEIIKNRFEPHHHFYMSNLFKEQFIHVAELDDEQILRYLRGETINYQIEKGFVAIKYQNAIVGFGKSDGRIIKNKYPKGLRIR